MPEQLEEAASLSARPFQNAADPELFVATSAHMHALGGLLTAIDEGMKGVHIRGPAGSGKTMIVRQLARLMEQKGASPLSLLVPPTSSSTEESASDNPLTLRLLSGYLGVWAPKRDDLRNAVCQALKVRANRRVTHKTSFSLLIFDEAHKLGRVSLHELVIVISRLRHAGVNAAVVLAGQSKPMAALIENDPVLQTALAAVKLKALDPKDQLAYIHNRLGRIDSTSHLVVKTDVTDVLMPLTAGNPRVINNTMARCVAAAALDGRNEINGAHIRAAARDLSDIRRRVRGVTQDKFDPLQYISKSLDEIQKLISSGQAMASEATGSPP